MAEFEITLDKSRGPRREWPADERGFALVFGLVFTFLFTLAALTFQSLGGMEADLVQRQVTHSQALYLAEAGLERAIYNLRLDPTWRGVDSLNGVAFANNNRALGNGSYYALLYDGTNDNKGLYDRNLDPAINPGISPGQVRLSSTGTAGPAGARSLRRVDARVEIENGFNVPSPIYFPGVLHSVKLENSFLIDGHDFDPLTGIPETHPCATQYGITSLGDVAGIRQELQEQHTGTQVVGQGSTPSVFQLGAGQGADVGRLVDQILAASQGQTFYQFYNTEKKIEDGKKTLWGCYPGDSSCTGNLQVTRVGGRLEVTNNSTLSGAGILIVDDEFRIDSGSTFDWKGLVIVANRDGRDDGDPELRDEGKGTLYGALLIGGANGDSELELKPGGARFLHSCDALNTVAFFSSFSALRKVTTESWTEVKP